MTRCFTRLLVAAAVAIAAAAPASTARAQATPDGLHLLDVPYLPQSEALCGGAAVAMVMRYWGATGVYADDFSALVDRDAGGIRGGDLLRELHARGWDAVAFRGDAASVQQHLSARRPVITLIEDRPGRYHYVVIVGWAGGRVILHDPARAPFRVIDEGTFVRAWEPTGFWTMLATRRETTATSDAVTSEAVPSRSTGGPCQGMVDEGVRLAGAGEVDDARRLFELAASSCPGSAAPWREQAGLHALASQWQDAAADARQALARDAHDEQAARILATALYLEGDSRGALLAWNALGEPRIDIVNVKGLERTRFAVAAAAIGLEPGSVLTAAGLDRAARRLAELPAAQVARVGYRPGEDGRAQLDAVVLERPLAPASMGPLAAVAARAATNRELAVTVSSPTGGGEAWRASWRWWEHRPRVSVGLDAPAPFGGTWGVEAAYNQQTYEDGTALVEETRRTAIVHAGDWTASALRWQVSGGIDSWRGRARSVTAGLSVEQRLFEDRLALRGQGAAWTLSGGAWTAALRSEWQSSVSREGQTWLARGGIALASAGAPLALWPGAGTGQGRDRLLRGHPLLHDGIVTEGVFGRRLADAGVEWRWWRTAGRGLARIAPAVFIDTARATHGLAGSTDRWQADAGAGVRVAAPGSGVLRVDVGRGLREGGWVFSAGWTR